VGGLHSGGGLVCRAPNILFYVMMMEDYILLSSLNNSPLYDHSITLNNIVYSNDDTHTLLTAIFTLNIMILTALLIPILTLIHL
jgi:hypothetical protein